MNRSKMRRIALIAAVAGLVGLVVFGLVNTTNRAQATTPNGAWKLIGQITVTKKGPSTCGTKDCHEVLRATIPASAKTALLVKDRHVIIVSNPPDPIQDYPHSWKVTAYKAPNLYLERIEDFQCTKPPAPSGAVSVGTRNIYTGPCDKPVVPGAGPENHLSGVFDIVVDNGNPAIDLYHCMNRFDINAGGDVKSSSVCFDNMGLFAIAGAEPINNPPGEGPDGYVGPQPPPPYGAAPPAKGVGSYIGDNLYVAMCFADVGSGVNIIVTLSISNAQAQLAATGKLVGAMFIYGPPAFGGVPQTNAACNTLGPTGAAPAQLGVTVYPATDIAKCPGGICQHAPWRLTGNVLHGYPDWDQDGCTDSAELWEPKPNNITKCGDDPWNPFDYVAGGNVSGEYDLTAVAQRQDVGAPGWYYNCKADINQSGKNLTARILCYTDSPAIVVNPKAVPAPNTGATTCPPAPAAFCGDGIPGAPPPGTTVGTYNGNPYPAGAPKLFVKTGAKQTVLNGVVDNGQNVIKLNGCFQSNVHNPPGIKLAGTKTTLLGDVWWDAIINLHTGHGQVKIWSQTGQGLPPCKNTVGVPLGSPPPGMDISPATQGSIMPLDIVRQANKVSPPAGRDSDSDGCPDKAELSDDPAAGGLRDPFNHYDYMNPSKDGVNRADDIYIVVTQYFIDDPVKMPDMKSQTDRTAIAGGNPWNLGPPNGQQRVDDILAQIKQYYHDC